MSWPPPWLAASEFYARICWQYRGQLHSWDILPKVKVSERMTANTLWKGKGQNNRFIRRHYLLKHRVWSQVCCWRNRPSSVCNRSRNHWLRWHVGVMCRQTVIICSHRQIIPAQEVTLLSPYSEAKIQNWMTSCQWSAGFILPNIKVPLCAVD